MMPLRTVEILTANGEETFRTGESLALLLRRGDIIALFGNLGSGKTVFTKGICRGLHVTDVVTSPTFTLIQEYYSGRLPVYHFDFYRLTALEDIELLDLDYYFYADGISVIEWADRGEPLLPPSMFRIELNRLPENQGEFNMRRLTITGPSDRPIERITA